MSIVQIYSSCTTGSLSTEKVNITNFYETDTSKLVGVICIFYNDLEVRIQRIYQSMQLVYEINLIYMAVFRVVTP